MLSLYVVSEIFKEWLGVALNRSYNNWRIGILSDVSLTRIVARFDRFRDCFHGRFANWSFVSVLSEALPFIWSCVFE